MQEVSRVGAQSVTSKSKLLAREMPGLRVDFGGSLRRKVAVWGRPGGKVDAPVYFHCSYIVRTGR